MINMSKERRKKLFRSIAASMGFDRHQVMPEWQKGNRSVLSALREIIPIQRGLFSRGGGRISVDHIPEDQRRV